MDWEVVHIYGNVLGPDAPKGLHLTVQQLAELEQTVRELGLTNIGIAHIRPKPEAE
jgi:hypothetical protein